MRALAVVLMTDLANSGPKRGVFRCLKQTQVCTPSEERVYIRFANSRKYDRIEHQLLWSSANARAEAGGKKVAR